MNMKVDEDEEFKDVAKELVMVFMRTRLRTRTRMRTRLWLRSLLWFL